MCIDFTFLLKKGDTSYLHNTGYSDIGEQRQWQIPSSIISLAASA